MKILFLAPQPFYQDRGTPIAVRLALEVLAGSQEHEVDLLCYHEGHDVAIAGVKTHRIKVPRFIHGVGPGISWKKLVCDFVFLLTALRMVWRSRREQYVLVHAVEESVFIACLLKIFFGIPFIYDMDSSLALQVTEKWFLLKPLAPLLALLERWAVRQSLAVVPVCDALAAIANRHGSKDTVVLSDISLLNLREGSPEEVNLRREAQIPEGELIVLYIGNLEAYQGIDLLLESFVHVARAHEPSHLVIIGGTDRHLWRYRDKVKSVGLDLRIHLLGPRPVSTLNSYLAQADVLVSPRIKGNNTPMKIYSYLHSGVPVVATELPTHTQVMDSQVAVLTQPTVEHYGQGILRLLQDELLRKRIGQAAYELAEKRYTFAVFRSTLQSIYDRVGKKIESFAAAPFS